MTYVSHRKPEGNIVISWIARFILRLMGWRITGMVPDEDKMVIVAGWHTSNMDGIIMILTGLSAQVRLQFMIKAELTRGVIGWLVRLFGGLGVDRRSSFGAVDSATELFKQRDHLALAVSPEGTRRKLDHWKTGFYWIAKDAGVPILCASIDYKRKEIHINGDQMFYPSGDIETDIEKVWDCYRDVTARYPERANDMRLRPTALRSKSSTEPNA
jgi:1-acyl-sn-glycerol-3-phosphate acyltransferase